MSFSAKVAVWRSERGLTQTEAAVRFGVTRKTVYMWETGAREPPLRLLGKVARETGIPLAELVMGRGAR